jgi:hypothetical protein
MSCGSSLNIDSTTLSGCSGHDHDEPHDDTTLYNMIDSTILGHCASHDDDSTLLGRVLLKHDSEADATAACQKWCKDQQEECKTLVFEKPEKSGDWHWTKPEGCKISCSWRNKK